MHAQDQTAAPAGSGNRESTNAMTGRSRQLALGFIFGLAFGFLLQKGGVAKFEVLIGVLILRDFTVIKVMLSAVVVGMLGVLLMHRQGMVELHIKPTRYAANIVGGLLFGVGFALSAYCPGTAAAALGQGNYDACFVMLGMMTGSFVFAEVSGRLSDTLYRWGDRGVLTLPQVLHAPRWPFITGFAAFLAIGLVLLGWLTGVS